MSAVITERSDIYLWDLTVERAHTFFVGPGQWLVHNCQFGDLIAHGHAWDDHALQTAFKDPDDLAQFVDSIIHNYDDIGRSVSSGNLTYWNEAQEMIVIVDEAAIDGGTVFFGTFDDFLRLTGQ